MRHYFWLAIVAALSLVAPSFAQESASPRSLDELAAAFDEVLADGGIPGAQVVVIQGGEVALAHNYGFADRANQTPVTDDTIFRVGSVSKSFVGVAAMMAVEEGLISLETPIAIATPDVEFSNPWEETHPVTLAHVMEHTAGFYDISLYEILMSEPGFSIADGLAVNPGNRVSRWRPGSYYSYANSGPAIAAHAIELARDQDYDSILRETVLRPIGMNRADLMLTPEVESRLSQSYVAGREEPVPYYHILMRPAGALNASALELSQFVRMMIGRGEVDGVRILNPTSVERIERSETNEATSIYGLETTYGLGNDSRYTGSRVLRGHGGSIDGFVASYMYDAELGIGIIVLLNQDDGSVVGRLETLATDYLLQGFEPELPPIVSVAQTELEPYVGAYVSRVERSRGEEVITSFDQPITVRINEDGIFEVAGVPRYPNGEYTMRVAGRAESSFTRAVGDDGRLELRYANTPYVQISPLQAFLRTALPLAIAAGAALIILYEILRIGAFAVRRIRGRKLERSAGPRFMRLFGVLAVLSLGVVLLLLSSIMSQHFTELGYLTTQNPTTLTIFALSILAPVFAALSLVVSIVGKGGAGIWNRGTHALASVLILAGAAWLTQWGWIGLQVWTF